MAKAEIKTLPCGVEATCKQLTVGEIRKWLESYENGDADLIGDNLHPEVRLSDLQLMAGLSDEDASRLTQDCIESLVNVCRELNPLFFAMLGRVLLRQ